MRLTALLFCSLICNALWAFTSQADERPNIVWLVAEDCSKHFFKHFDADGAATPNIELLAKQGITFERAFCNAPVCSVARTTLITGCYAPRIGTQYHRRAVMAPLPAGLKMFPSYLRDAGYYTTNKQKTDYNCLGQEDAWDESSRNASWKNRDDGQPFFHFQSFGVTHESSLHFHADEFANKPTETDPKSVFISPRHPITWEFRYTYARYHDQIKKLDKQVGTFIAELESAGELDNTIVFFFSDHGGALPGSKGYLYETGLHVPLIVRVPPKWQHLVPLDAGSRSKAFVSFVDFAPTMIKLAGIDIPDQIDGQPFLGEGLTESDLKQRGTTFGYADRFDEKIDMVRSLRRGKFKYIRSFTPQYPDGLQNNYRYRMHVYRQWRDMFNSGDLSAPEAMFFEPRPAELLFEVESDPYETKNLTSDSRYQEHLAIMRDQLTKHLKETNDLSFFPESFLAENAMDDPTTFGNDNSELIAQMIDIANYALQPFDEIEKQLQKAMKTTDHRHDWAVQSCLVHGRATDGFRLNFENPRSIELMFKLYQPSKALSYQEFGEEELKKFTPIQLNEWLNTFVLLFGDNAESLDMVSRAANNQHWPDDKLLQQRMDFFSGKWLQDTEEQLGRLK